MGKLGFRCFTQPVLPVAPTLRDRVKALTDEQRAALLLNFRMAIPSGHLNRLLIPKEIIDYVYDGIDAIQEKCRSLMRSEVVVTPEVSHIDPVTHLKVIDTPAVMNVVPTTQVQLKTAVSPYFIDDYPQLFITNTVQELVNWCKYDGSGTFAFYKNNIIL